MKNFNGKAIYNPSGKAGEYSYWACNFYKGCSNGCTYCYLKKGRGAAVLGGDTPVLKRCFRDEQHALEIFQKELQQNIEELRKYGLFFTFTSDPMLPETIYLTMLALAKCIIYEVPVKILTKNANFLNYNSFQTACLMNLSRFAKEKIAFGFTLTGHDELEPGASTNEERIEAMAKLHEAGFKTFASIEPIIDFESSINMIYQTTSFCDLYKIGLESGKKYDKEEAKHFLFKCTVSTIPNRNKIYFKDSLLKIVGYDREKLKLECCVNRDYNLFK